MAVGAWLARVLRQVRGATPFGGDCLPGRVPLFARGRPSLPFPHPWNYREPLRILETFYAGTDRIDGPAKHNRYLDVLGFPPVLVTRDPAIIRAVLADTGEKPGQFDRDQSPARGIARATGEDSLLYANGATWRAQKKLATQPFKRSTMFQPERFHEFEQTFRATIEERLEVLRAHQAASGERVTRLRLEPEIQVVMLEMLVNNFFGGEVEYEELRDRYVPAITGLIEHMVRDTVRSRPRAALARLGKRGRALERAKADFEALTDIALAGRPGKRALWSQFESDATDDELRSNIRVFLAGALEATTSLASWALSHLSRDAELQEAIHAEVDEVETYDPEDLAQAVTLNRTIDETLRLTPSLYFLPRRATEDTVVRTKAGAEMHIPAGARVVLDVWHANRCDDFWGEEATGHPAATFQPDRWRILDERGVSPRDAMHFGFGHGPRYCPGKFLGLLEVGLVVGAFVKVFRFRAVEATTQARAGVSTKPADGVLVDLETRS